MGDVNDDLSWKGVLEYLMGDLSNKTPQEVVDQLQADTLHGFTDIYGIYHGPLVQRFHALVQAANYQRERAESAEREIDRLANLLERK